MDVMGRAYVVIVGLLVLGFAIPACDGQRSLSTPGGPPADAGAPPADAAAPPADAAAVTDVPAAVVPDAPAGPEPQPPLAVMRAPLAVGSDHACAIRADGSLWCWGSNKGGQLGDGTKVSRSAPVRVGEDS